MIYMRTLFTKDTVIIAAFRDNIRVAIRRRQVSTADAVLCNEFIFSVLLMY